MRSIDHSFVESECNLACDEFLLNSAEDEQGGESLRLWESPSYFVVLGVAQVLADEVNEAACARDSVPIMRRCSAGGCVLQGPGCLNFSLVFDQETRPEMRTIRGSYGAILDSLVAVLRRHHEAIRMDGISDVVFGERKISGNAQRRRKRFILHHGTLLYAFDASRLQLYLHEPSARPAYRGERLHSDFVTNIPLRREEAVSCLRDAFGIGHPVVVLAAREENVIRGLAETKYRDPNWIRRR